ncbi:MAG: serine/threonine-protein phosphatase [Fimbriimonadales bacterium]|nr:serine/threonine-protein phosphatase [Fimbriimonadales bacterium]
MEDTTAEFSKDELATADHTLTHRVKVSVACKTDLGRIRENNEDKFEYFIPEDESTLAARGAVFVVCDGMGGHAAGQIASELTAKTFIDVYLNHTASSPQDAARAAVAAANRYVLDIGRQIPGRSGMGTTLSALIVWADRAITVQVGDSRIYRLRDGILEQLSVDHTFVEEQVRLGAMSRDDAEQSPYAHVLTRAVGVEESITPDVEERELKAGDVFLLCSDGLTNHVQDDEIRILLESSPSTAVWKLVNAALMDGGRDNVTALAVRIDSIEPV